MSKRILTTLFVSALMVGLVTDPAAGAQTDSDPLAADLIEPWISNDAPGVAVAISIDGEPVFAAGAGLANLEHNRPITPDTPFQVASVSKQFTVFATLLLVDSGELELDHDVRSLLPELESLPFPITVAHLIDHASGLRETANLTNMAGWLNDDIRTQEQVLDLIFRQRNVNFEAGTDTSYNNTGYVLLAEIVARVSGQTFQEFTSERIFRPLRMTQTRFRGARNDVIAGVASAYYPGPDGFHRVIGANETVGSTGLVTSANDLLLWADNFRIRQIGSDRVFDLMAERFTADNGEESVFARGQEYRVYNGIGTWSHGGRADGFRAFLLRAPEQGLALSIVSNRTDFDTAALAFALVDRYLANDESYVPAEIPEWTPADEDRLQAFEGTYEIYPGIIFDFIALDEGLGFRTALDSADALVPLEQVGERRFMLNSATDTSILFAPEQGGSSPRLEYVIGLHGSLSGHRITPQPFTAEGIDLAEYAGVYESPELATSYTLTAVDGQLSGHHARRGGFGLMPFQPDIFISANGPLQEVSFVRDSQGRVIGLLASTQLARNVVFHKRQE